MGEIKKPIMQPAALLDQPWVWAEFGKRLMLVTQRGGSKVVLTAHNGDLEARDERGVLRDLTADSPIAKALAAVPDMRAALRAMQAALDEALRESTNKGPAANWKIINDAACAARDALAKSGPQPLHRRMPALRRATPIETKDAMTTPAQYGEPWINIGPAEYGVDVERGGKDCWERMSEAQITRAVACVNAMAGIPDEALEKVREWLELLRRQNEATKTLLSIRETASVSEWDASYEPFLAVTAEKVNVEKILGTLLAKVRT